MKIKVYADVHPWTTPENLFVTCLPSAKPDGAIRYEIDIEIPDPKQPDVILEGKVVVV